MPPCVSPFRNVFQRAFRMKIRMKKRPGPFAGTACEKMPKQPGRSPVSGTMGPRFCGLRRDYFPSTSSAAGPTLRRMACSTVRMNSRSMPSSTAYTARRS